jgi:protein O-GlcNAc transferase
MTSAIVAEPRDATDAVRDRTRRRGVTRTLNAALAHHQAGRLARAETLYRKALAKDPDNPDALHLLGALAFQRGQFREAIALIERALPALDALPEAHVNLGNALLAVGETARAGESYHRAVALDSAHGLAHSNLARVYLDQGDYGTALAHAERALAQAPDFLGARANFAEALMGLRRFAEAEAVLRQALQLAPEQPALLRNLGRVLARQSRFAEAAESLEKVAAYAPTDPSAQFELGRVLCAAGRPAEAAESYRRALELAPGSAEAHLALGEVLEALGQPEAAADSYRRAIQLKRQWNIDLQPKLAEPDIEPDGPRAAVEDAGSTTQIGVLLQPAANATLTSAHIRLGMALLAQGQFEDAIECFRQAIAEHPATAAGYHCLGVALHAQARAAEAVAALRHAIALQPNYAQAHNDLGVVYHGQHEIDAAIECFRRAGAVKPDFALAYYNLGNTLLEQSRLDEAAASYRHAIEVQPDFAQAYSNLGRVLGIQGRIDEAVAAHERAIALKPGDPAALNNLGALFKELGRLDAAIDVFRRALEANPDDAAACNNLGTVYMLQGQGEEAIAAYRRALALDPELVEALCNLGEILSDRGDLSEALACLERARALDPENEGALARCFRLRQSLCDWRGSDALEAQLRRGGPSPRALSVPFILLGAHTTAEEQLDRTRPLAQLLEQRDAKPFARRRARAGERLRIGYLSADFRQHPVGYLCAGLIEQHDRDGFEVFGYSYGPDDGGPMRQRFVKAFDRFIDIRQMPHRSAAEQIYRDGIDILVDLTGYTWACRPKILAHRPAPVQVNYLGYPGTMGADFVDYILVDPIVAPPADQPYFTEKLVQLPFTYQCNDNLRPIAAETPTRAAYRLPAHGFVFCCFNNSYKITPEIFDIWMRLLRAVPGSVLWTLIMPALARDNLMREAAARGVEPRRIVMANGEPLAQHLARHRLADLFLDTLPYNAHTTASDALWAGLPLVTCIGNTFPGRVAASLLHAVGLPELATASLAEYEALALRLARDPGLLAGFRERLARNRLTYPLFDTARSARAIEWAFREMHRRHAAGLPPAPFAVPDPGGTPPA